MPNLKQTAWVRTVVKIWAPLAGVIGALKVLLFDVPEIYHKISLRVSLEMMENLLLVVGDAIFLVFLCTVPFDKHPIIQRSILVGTFGGLLLFKPGLAGGAALVAWIGLIFFVIIYLKESSETDPPQAE